VIVDPASIPARVEPGKRYEIKLTAQARGGAVDAPVSVVLRDQGCVLREPLVLQFQGR